MKESQAEEVMSAHADYIEEIDEDGDKPTSSASTTGETPAPSESCVISLPQLGKALAELPGYLLKAETAARSAGHAAAEASKRSMDEADTFAAARLHIEKIRRIGGLKTKSGDVV